MSTITASLATTILEQENAYGEIITLGARDLQRVRHRDRELRHRQRQSEAMSGLVTRGMPAG